MVQLYLYKLLSTFKTLVLKRTYLKKSTVVESKIILILVIFFLGLKVYYYNYGVLQIFNSTARQAFSSTQVYPHAAAACIR